MEQDMEEKIFRMYADGKSIDEIEEYLKLMYGADVSNSLVNHMLNKIIKLHPYIFFL